MSHCSKRMQSSHRKLAAVRLGCIIIKVKGACKREPLQLGSCPRCPMSMRLALLTSVLGFCLSTETCAEPAVVVPTTMGAFVSPRRWL